jgi:tRNA (guanine37-N1)-methyltransferase
MEVPAVLLGGDHGAIERWRRRESLGRTWLRRPDLLAGRTLSSNDQVLLDEFIEAHRRGLPRDGTD